MPMEMVLEDWRGESLGDTKVMIEIGQHLCQVVMTVPHTERHQVMVASPTDRR